MRSSQQALAACLCATVAVGSLAARPLDAAPQPLRDYTITSWSRRDGISTPIWAICQDKEGYLWVGTGSGLLRFDGHRFVSWDALGYGPLPGNVVLSLLSARDGSLWIGFAEAGIGRLRHGAFTAYRDPEGLAFTRRLVEDRHGTVWAGSRGGLYQFDGTRWEHHAAAAGLPAGPNNGIYEDADGMLWVRTLQGTYRRERSGHAFVPVTTTPAFRRPPTSRAASRQRVAAGELNPFTALQDRRGDIWRGTIGQGLSRFRFAHATVDIERVTSDTGLLSNVVGAVYEDDDSNIWIGTQAGLHQLTPRKVTPIEHLGAVAVVQATSDGSIWFGGDNGLIRITKEHRRIYTERQGVPPGPVRAIAIDRRGRLWVATDRGVACFVQERFVRIPMPEWHGFNRIVGVSVDSQDAVWLSDIRLGLLRLQNGVLAPFDTLATLQGSPPVSAYVDRADRVWVGFADGRLGLLGADGRVSMHDLGLKGPIGAISEDREGALLIGGEDGIARFANGKSVAITMHANGLPGSHITAVIDDERGAVWAGTNAGIVRVEGHEFDIAASSPSHRVRYMLYDETDGLDGMPVRLAAPAAARSGDGRLWFVSDGGATVVDPASLGQARRAPRVRIEEVRAAGRRFDPTVPFRVGPRPERVEIDYTALIFSSPTSVRFRYRLNGFDSDWQDAGSRRQASYTNLPPGQYSFQVVARDKQGSFDSSGATTSFSIEPAFYQTSSFFLSLAAAIAGLGTLAWRLRVRQIRERFALVLAERARISREVHDTCCRVSQASRSRRARSPSAFHSLIPRERASS
jgi:ligand-binding sensor domain-containing protein